MRVPLIRFGESDHPPIAWWEWCFAPLMIIIGGLVMIAIFAVSVPIGYWSKLQRKRERKRIVRKLKASGRFADWKKIEPEILAGHGTLLFEHCSPKGPIRCWWTEDDLIGTAPAPLPKTTGVVDDPNYEWLVEYTLMCMSRYIDFDKGSASLVELPYSIAHGIGSRFSKANIVTLVKWFDPIVVIVIGDPETVL